jgi:hypothetical protein
MVFKIHSKNFMWIVRLIIVALGVQLTNCFLETPSNNSRIQRSTWVKYHVQKVHIWRICNSSLCIHGGIIQKIKFTRFEQMVQNPKWENAMDEEMMTFETNCIWKLVFLRCNWMQMVYKVKHNMDGFVNRYKVRLILEGYAKTYGIDFEKKL